MNASYPATTHRRNKRYDQTYSIARLAPWARTGPTHESGVPYLVLRLDADVDQFIVLTKPPM